MGDAKQSLQKPEPKLPDVKVSVFNFSSQVITEGEISLFKLGKGFVPANLVPATDTQVDILRFSRKLLLKARFYDSDYEN